MFLGPFFVRHYHTKRSGTHFYTFLYSVPDVPGSCVGLFFRCFCKGKLTERLLPGCFDLGSCYESQNIDTLTVKSSLARIHLTADVPCPCLLSMHVDQAHRIQSGPKHHRHTGWILMFQNSNTDARSDPTDTQNGPTQPTKFVSQTVSTNG